MNACLGSAQETSVEIVHVIGASLVFGVGVIYAAVQTALTYHMYPDYNGLYICRVRLTLTVVSFIVMIISILTLKFLLIFFIEPRAVQLNETWKHVAYEVNYFPFGINLNFNVSIVFQPDEKKNPS